MNSINKEITTDQVIVLRNDQCHICRCAFSTSVNSLRFASFVHIFLQSIFLEVAISCVIGYASLKKFYMCKTFLNIANYVPLSVITLQLL